MKKRFCGAIVLGLTIMAVILLPPPTQAGDSFRFRGQSAEAFFSKTNSSGCIVTDVFVFASDDTSVAHDPPGPPNSFSGSSVSLFISQFDFCTATQLLAADCFASLADGDFQVDRELQQATLNTPLECFDFVSATSFNVAVDLTWTSTGDPVPQSSNSHFRTPGFIVHSRIRGTFRPAQASGSVSDGVTNFTPDPSVFAQIVSAQSGTVVID